MRLLPLVTFAAYALLVIAAAAPAGELRITPSAIQLQGPESSAQVLVTESLADGLSIDRTSDADYEIAHPEIAAVDERGLLEPRGEGSTVLIIRTDQGEVRAAVHVTGVNQPARISFRDDVIPVLTKAGCNSGGCHGKAEGQNGFKLSLFGFDAHADYEALIKESRGRRIHPTAPQESLLLRKAAAITPHGGGRAIALDSYGYRRILRWIREGAALETEHAAPAVRIEIMPSERRLRLGDRQQLRVVAIDAAGRHRDVTAETEYETNAPTIAEVDERGLVQGGDIPGEAAILARYMGHVAVCGITIPRPNIEFTRPPEANFIDTLVWDKLQQLGIEPSGICDDAAFLRRASLDTIGTLPTAEEARRFLESRDPQKRAKWVDELLEREEYADYWSLRWSDLLRVDANALGPEAAFAMSRWLRRQFARNRPYHELVSDIVTAAGNTSAEGPAPMYATLNQPKELAGAVSQLFLGVRIECAECHHHPFERWSQQDFYAFAGFFTGIKQKTLPDGTKAVVAGPSQDLKHPRTGETVPAAGLGQAGAAANAPLPGSSSTAADRRQVLADWMTSPDNPYFARSIANRLWAHYFGRGLVEPIDDMRTTNPATNEPLLDALAAHLRDVDFDLKAFTRTLLTSNVYQLESASNASNASDEQHFSHASFRPLPAEVLLDAICQATHVPEKFNGWPVGARAIQVWDNRMPSYFLRIFGRPGRTTVCECERGNAPTISQALHLMNSPEIVEKVRHRHGRARQLAETDRPPHELIEELYLSTLSRLPSAAERQLMRGVFDDPDLDRRTAVEDILWALLNTKEFLFNH